MVYKFLGKRIFDLAICLSGSLILLPIFLFVALLVRLNLGTPIFFTQQRPGKNGVPFTIYKFRTMSNAKEANGNLLPDIERLTRFGRLLRSSSLDELPAMYNVLLGDMSLVGPRPLLMQYLDRYTSEEMRRHEVKPGITGWAQVNGRNSISWEEKFSHDIWYVDNLSFWLDLRILALTLFKVVERDGISEAGEATMSEYMGSAHDKPHIKCQGDGSNTLKVQKQLSISSKAINWQNT